MKKHFFLIFATMLASVSLFTQSNNNVDEVVNIEHYATRQYCEGEMIVRFNPASAGMHTKMWHRFWHEQC